MISSERSKFHAQAEKRYCLPHFNMEKKMEFYGFKQNKDGKPTLTVEKYKDKFLRLHKYAHLVICLILSIKENLFHLVYSAFSVY